MASTPMRPRSRTAPTTPAEEFPDEATPAMMDANDADVQAALPPAPDGEGSELGAVMGQISERMGVNVMRRASVIPGFCHLESDIFTLDMALLGGLAEGLVAQIYGWESSGKTTTAMRYAAAAQRKYPDKAVTWVDAEQTLDNTWARRHGVDDTRLLIAQPESGEQAVDILDAVLRARETSLVIVDSLPALVPQAEAEASAEDFLVAARARLIGRMCSKILAATLDQRHRGNFPTVILINQWRMKIGGGPKSDPRVLPGGMQPKFLSTTMFEMKNKEHLGRDARGTEVVDWNDHAFTIKKSKVGNSLRNGEFTMIRDPDHPLGVGAIDEAAVVATYAKRFGVITGGGSSWHIDGIDHRFRKLEEIVAFLYAEEDTYRNLKRRLISMQRVFQGLPPFPPDGYLLGYI